MNNEINMVPVIEDLNEVNAEAMEELSNGKGDDEDE